MKSRMMFWGAALVLASASASAGFVQPAPITLDLTARVASGDMVTARFSSNTVEFIGCGVRHTEVAGGSVVSTAFCQAGNAAGDTFTCFSINPALIDSMALGNDYSFITFRWNQDGECTHVGFSTQSFYIPEHVDKKK